MVISELIEKLQEIQNKHGDVEIMYYFHGEGEKFTYYEVDYNKGFWYCFKPVTYSISLPSKLFPEVQWSDNEPTKVKLIIEK